MNQANQLHSKAIQLAKDYLNTEAQLLTVLMEMQSSRAFAELNYANIFDYCERALNLSRAQGYYFKTVAERSVVVRSSSDYCLDKTRGCTQGRGSMYFHQSRRPQM